LEVTAIKRTHKEALRAIEDARGKSGNRSTNDAYDLVENTDATLSTGVALEEREDDRYAKDDKDEGAILLG